MSELLDEITVELTKDKLESILTKYFFKEGYDVKTVTFNIIRDEDRFGFIFPPKLSTVTCKLKKVDETSAI